MPSRLSFSPTTPDVQIAWDSTSIGSFMECPRKYLYNIVLGWVPRDESVHLTFGLYYHAAIEEYDKAKARGASHQLAIICAVRKALTDSWDPIRKRPWYSDHKYKNRFTLVRSIVGYLDHFAEDPLETVILANGKPAVELSWRIELGTYSKDGEPYLLCGHLDRVANWQSNTWIVDHKTTNTTISPEFFERYSPDNQFSTYTYGGKIVYQQPIHGLIADVTQIMVDGDRFQRGFVMRTESQLEEWRRDLDYWIDQAEARAREGYWPLNTKSCGLYGGCPYRKVCGKSPGVREDWLKASYTQRLWDPLRVRGDI